MFDNVANTDYMVHMRGRVERLKQVHYIAAIILFVGTLIFCSFYASDISLEHTSLSHYGIYKKIGIVWNVSLFIIGITLFIEAFLNMNKYMKGSWLIYFFIISLICLLLTASVNMNHRIHYYFAFTYFIGYTLSIFLFGYLLMKSDLRMGITSIIISVLSVVCPLGLVMYLHSFAIPEIAHTVFVFVWVSITKFDIQYRNFLKRFGL